MKTNGKKLDTNELEAVSGGQIIEKDGNFIVPDKFSSFDKDKHLNIIDRTLSFDNEEDAKECEELLIKLNQIRQARNNYLMYYNPNDWDDYLHHNFNMKFYDDIIEAVNKEIEKLTNKNNNKI